jgi:hypothetical protein
LGHGFRDEEATEAVVHELNADDAFTGLAVADVDDAALGSEVVPLGSTARASLGERDRDVEIHADGNIETGFKGSAAAAKILAGSNFFEGNPGSVTASDGDRQAHCDAALGAGLGCRKGPAGTYFLNHVLALSFHDVNSGNS